MIEKSSFYGVVSVLVAGLVLLSSATAFYYLQYREASAADQRHLDELDVALRSYNASLSLLADAVTNLNTSTSLYRNASEALTSLWTRYTSLASVEKDWVGYKTDLLVDFGNGTRHWLNGTWVQPGWNGYVATVVLLGGKVGAVWYPQFGEHFVTSISGVESSATSSWFVWVYTDAGWEQSLMGADEIRVFNGTAIAWTLCGFDAAFNPTCTP